MLGQMAAICPGELHGHQNQRRNQQHHTYPTKLRDPEQRASSAKPLLGVAKVYTQKQHSDGKTANSQQPRDSLPREVRDITNGDHRLHYARNELRPEPPWPTSGM